MSQFKNLVFEGGGVRGIAYAGAIEALQVKNEILPNIRRVAGTSAGAITAALLAAGATSSDIERILSETDFTQFMDGNFFGGVYRLINRYGWYKGDAFAEWMREQLGSVAGNPDITFEGLARKTGRSLIVVGTDLTGQKTREYSPATDPGMPVWEAVRISMSIPLFFASMMMQGRVMVDGGLTWNYPIDIFDDMKYISDPSDTGRFTIPTYTRYDMNHVYNHETLGFRVDNKDEILAEKISWDLPRKNVGNLGEYLVALTDFVQGMANKAHLHENDWHRTVFIDALDVPFTNFSLDQVTIRKLVDSGRDCTNAYFKWFEGGAEGAKAPKNRVRA